MQLAVELGSCWIRGARRGQAPSFSQASLVARDANSLSQLALGDAAEHLKGAPASVQIIRPVKAGCILEWSEARSLLKLAIQTLHPSKSKPSLALVVPAQLTLVQRRAWLELAKEAGAAQVILVESPLCCIAGCGCDVSRPLGRLLLDWGGGTLNLGLVAGKQMLASQSLVLGGLDIDLALQRWVRQHHGILLSLSLAEAVKIQLLAIGRSQRSMEVTGLGVIDGLPKSAVIHQAEIAGALQPFLIRLREALLQVIGQASPEVCADILEEGLWCCGGSSRLEGLGEFLEQITGLRVIPVQTPEQAAIRGLADWIRCTQG